MSERPTVNDRAKPLSAKPVEVSLAFIRVVPGGATCSCGWATAHKRKKVAEDRAERHVNKTHGGQAAWM